MCTESLIKLAKFVLKNNHCEFSDRFRKQKEVTAIETKFAPPSPLYAIVFLAVLEEEILESLLEKPWLWRYTDNIFLIWHHVENELERFIDKLNKFHPTINFT